MSGLELHLYDFDGTLFRSPAPPASWDGNWWADTRSLTPPCIPEHPGNDWWVQSTVREARKSISRSDVWAVMMTGREQASGLRMVIPQLLKGAGLNFDEVHLTPTGSAIAEKIKRLISILRRHPDIDTVRIWDDRPSHLRDFERVLSKLGYEVSTELVRARGQEALCGEGLESGALPAKPRYIGIFLDSKSRATLAKEFGLAHHKAQNDHITLQVGGPYSKDLLSLVGTRVDNIKVVGYAEDSLGQAVKVSLPSWVPVQNKTPHVTLSHDGSVGPVYSNKLFDVAEIDPVRGVSISGVIDTDPRSLSPKLSSAKRVALKYSGRGK